MENLDTMSDDELYTFAAATRGVRPRKAARHYLGTDRNGATRAIRDLNNYAWNLITARACRRRGEISTAQRYERICDRIYGELPAIARW